MKPAACFCPSRSTTDSVPGLNVRQAAGLKVASSFSTNATVRKQGLRSGIGCARGPRPLAWSPLGIEDRHCFIANIRPLQADKPEKTRPAEAGTWKHGGDYPFLRRRKAMPAKPNPINARVAGSGTTSVCPLAGPLNPLLPKSVRPVPLLPVT